MIGANGQLELTPSDMVPSILEITQGSWTGKYIENESRRPMGLALLLEI
jgi:hypothetical protein